MNNQSSIFFNAFQAPRTADNQKFNINLFLNLMLLIHLVYVYVCEALLLYILRNQAERRA